MAVTTYYTLSISGTVNIPFDQRAGIEQEWSDLVGPAPSNDKKPWLSVVQAAVDADLGWPDGFLRPNVEVAPRVLAGARNQPYDLGGGWEIHDWKVGVEPAAFGAHTKVTFVAEAEFEGRGGIDDHKASQKLDAAWFFEHATKQWHLMLKARLSGFNDKHKGEMIAPAWFQEFEFYCGNGGGGGE